MELSAVLDDGTTVRDNLVRLEINTGQTPEQLVPVECPDEVKYLWTFFRSINARRGSNGFGPNPITWADMEAWQRRRGIELSDFEHRALEAIEVMYLTKKAKK